jgi:hypothetical protein
MRAAVGGEELGQQVEEGGLAGAVGADQRVDGTAHHRQVDLADRGEPFEFLGELACFENDVAHLAKPPGCGGKNSVMLYLQKMLLVAIEKRAHPKCGVSSDI